MLSGEVSVRGRIMLAGQQGGQCGWRVCEGRELRRLEKGQAEGVRTIEKPLEV